MPKFLCFLVLLCLTVSLKAQHTIKKVKEDTTVYTAVEVEPEFPGGEAAVGKFFTKHIHVPKNEDNLLGKIVMRWIVEKDGSISHIEILKGLSVENSLHIINDLKFMPKWKPGLMKNKPVRVQFTCPLTICLGDF